MGDIFINELANTANSLIQMLADCEMEIIEYVTDCVCNNGYVFVDDLQKLDKEGE